MLVLVHGTDAAGVDDLDLPGAASPTLYRWRGSGRQQG